MGACGGVGSGSGRLECRCTTSATKSSPSPFQPMNRRIHHSKHVPDTYSEDAMQPQELAATTRALHGINHHDSQAMQGMHALKQVRRVVGNATHRTLTKASSNAYIYASSAHLEAIEGVWTGSSALLSARHSWPCHSC